MAATYDLKPLLATIESATSRLLPCEQAQILRYDEASEEFFRSGQTQVRISARIGASARAAATQKTIRVNTGTDQETLVVPLVAPEGDLMGVLHVLGPGDHRFSEAESALALMLGGLAAIALKRQTLVDQAAEKVRLDRELSLARELVQPAPIPARPGYRLAGAFHPAQQVGGDAYECLPVGPHRLALLVADASGHGLDSALLVSRCRAYFRALADLPLTRLVTRINRLLAEDLSRDERFVAASFAVLENDRLEVLGAGQGACLCLPSGREVEPAGPPLGLFPEHEYESTVLELAPGDLVAFYTDGLPDWRDKQGECYGEARLAEALRKWRLDTGQIYADARAFGGPQADDVSLLILERAPSDP